MKPRLSPAQAADLLQALVGLGKAQALYPPGHAAVARARKELSQVSGPIFDEEKPLLIARSEGYAVIGGQPFLGHNPKAEELSGWLRHRGVEGVIVSARVGLAEWDRFCRWLRSDDGEGWDGREITLTKVKRGGSAWDRAFRVHRTAVEALEEAYREVEEGRIPDAERARRCVEEFSELLTESPGILRGLVLIKDYDHYTFHHSVNVCVLSLGLGRQLGLSRSEQECLGFGALLHDIGKTRMPAELVRKPGQLSATEWSHMWRHPELGRDILGEMGSAPAQAGRLVLEHHMLAGGGGYPVRAPGYAVCPLSPLVTITDTYDAMTTHRPYSAPLPLPEAVHTMRRLQETHFAPRVLEVFLTMIGEIPVGSVVRLTSGEVAMVTRVQDSGEVGRVLPVFGADGKRLEISAQREKAVQRKEVVRWVDPLAHGIEPADVFRALG